MSWRSVGCCRSYKQGNSLRCEITDASRRWDPARFWLKWHWDIHYWVVSEVYAKSHDERLTTDGDTSRWIPSDAKWQTHLKAEIPHVFGQSDTDTYISGSTLKYMPSAMTNGWLYTEIYAGEFPKMRNYKRTMNMSSSSVMVKVTSKYTLLGHFWSICQVPWRTVGYRRSYNQGNSLRCEITIKDSPT
jgi:hypothetical protein